MDEQQRLESIRRASAAPRLDPETVRAAQQPVLQALARAGFPSDDLSSFARRYAPVPTAAVQILLDELEKTRDDTIREWLARALTASRCEFPGAALVAAFDGSKSPLVRWAIANALAETEASGVEEWLVQRALDRSLGKAREMLMLAVARHLSPERALMVLRQCLPDLPGHVAIGLREIGTPEDAGRLLEARASAPAWAKKEIDRSVKLIQARA